MEKRSIRRKLWALSESQLGLALKCGVWRRWRGTVWSQEQLDTVRPHLANKMLALPGITMANKHVFFNLSQEFKFSNNFSAALWGFFFLVYFLNCFIFQLRSFEGFLKTILFKVPLYKLTQLWQEWGEKQSLSAEEALVYSWRDTENLCEVWINLKQRLKFVDIAAV